jgi:hypothetical protein
MATHLTATLKPTLEGESHMVDILHKVGIKSSSQNDVYKALTTAN